MKRAYKLWKRITEPYMRIIPFLLYVIFLAVTIIIIEPRYNARISSMPFENKQLLYILGSAVVFSAFAFNMINVLGEAVKREYQLQYWLVLSRREFFIYLFLKKIYWYYLFLIMIYIVSGALWKNKFFLCVFDTLLYTALIYFIYVIKSADKSRRNKRILVRRKRNIQREISLFRNHSNMELIFLGWKYRYAYVGNLISKAGVIGVGFLLLKWNLSEVACFAVFFVMFLLLVLADDDYWKKESKNICLLQSMGVAFARYYFINLASGILFYSVLISLLYGLVSGSVFGGILFLLVGVCFVCYWILAYLFLYLSKAGEIEPLKLLLFIAALILEFIPILNLGTGILFYRKAYGIWRRGCVRDTGH